MQPAQSSYTTSQATPGSYQTSSIGATQPGYAHTTSSYSTTGPVTQTYGNGTTVTTTASRTSTQTAWSSSWVSGFSRYGPSELRGLFDRYDRDRSGYITFEELRSMYAEQGTPISDSALVYLQNTYDANRDGRLSYPEFHEFMTGRPLTGAY